MEKRENDDFDEKMKDLAWGKFFPQVKLLTICNLIASLVMFFLLVKKVDIYEKYTRAEYPVLGYVFPVILVILVVNLCMILVKKDETRMDVVCALSILCGIIAIVMYIVFNKEIGNHMSTYEQFAYNLVRIEAVIQIVSCLLISRAYSKICAK